MKRCMDTPYKSPQGDNNNLGAKEAQLEQQMNLQTEGDYGNC